MLNAMVASSKKQATAMIAWLKLNPAEWEAVAYGDPIHKIFANARLVRPSEGVHQEHTDWVLDLEHFVSNQEITMDEIKIDDANANERFDIAKVIVLSGC